MPKNLDYLINTPGDGSIIVELRLAAFSPNELDSVIAELAAASKTARRELPGSLTVVDRAGRRI